MKYSYTQQFKQNYLDIIHNGYQKRLNGELTECIIHNDIEKAKLLVSLGAVAHVSNLFMFSSLTLDGFKDNQDTLAYVFLENAISIWKEEETEDNKYLRERIK